MALALIGNILHANAIIGYNFNFLPLRIMIYFFLMIGFEGFFLIYTTYIGFHNMNYLRFTYFDLIPSKKPINVSVKDYREVISKLRHPYQFKQSILGPMLFLLIFFLVIYCIPVTFYMLFIGNFPPQSGDFLVMQYTPYIIILLNTFFIIGGLFLWSKIPHAIQIIPEELYSIPPKYLDILLRMHPNNRNILAELQNSTNE